MPQNLKAILSRFTPGFWAGIVANLLLLIIAVLLFKQWLAQGEVLANKALENGQRILIGVEDGVITGHPYEPPAPPKEDAATSEPTPIAEQPATEPAQEAPANIEAPKMSEATQTPGQTALKLLRDAPLPALQEDGNQGKLPIVSADGMTAWREYGRTLIADEAKPRISIVISGLGLSQALTTQVLEQVPPDVSLSFSPYAPDLVQWAQFTRAKGHEIWVDFPLEPRDYPVSDPGPFGLNRREPEEENLRRLYWVLSRIPSAVGLIAPAEESFFSQTISGKPIAQEIARRGVLLAYANPKAIASTALVKLPENSLAWKALAVQQQLDASPSAEAVDGFFRGLEAQARDTGMAVGIMPALPLAIERLMVWQKDLEARGLVLAPLTAQLTSPYKAPVHAPTPAAEGGGHGGGGHH